MAIVKQTEIVCANNQETIIANTLALSNASANLAFRVTLGGIAQANAYGSATPAESAIINLRFGAAVTLADPVIFSAVVPLSPGGTFSTEQLVVIRGTSASNLQLVVVATDPVGFISAPTTNGAVNVSNTGNLTVSVSALGGGANGNVLIESCVIANVV